MGSEISQIRVFNEVRCLFDTLGLAYRAKEFSPGGLAMDGAVAANDARGNDAPFLPDAMRFASSRAKANVQCNNQIQPNPRHNKYQRHKRLD
jgi:hypothetical protein